jgi:hypothetical protein
MDIFEWILMVFGISDPNGYQRREPRTRSTAEPS